MFPILLASSSPRRRSLLEQVGFVVSAHAADIDETSLPGEAPRALVRRLARAKAATAMSSAPPGGPAVGVAADTVVWAEGLGALGKPSSPEDAATMLRALSGAVHNVSTGFCVFERAGSSVVAEDVVTTQVEFRALKDRDIRAYVDTGEPMDKAGAYGIQGLGAVLVRGIVGSYTNVVGLPVEAVVEAVRGVGLLSGMPWEGA